MAALDEKVAKDPELDEDSDDDEDAGGGLFASKPAPPKPAAPKPAAPKAAAGGAGLFGDDDDGNGGGGFSSSRYQPVSAALSEPRQPRRNIADLRFEHNNSDSSDVGECMRQRHLAMRLSSLHPHPCHSVELEQYPAHGRNPDKVGL